MFDSDTETYVIRHVWNNEVIVTVLDQSNDFQATYQDSWDTEEGWSSLGEHYYVENGEIYCDVLTDGCDCDGNFSTYGTYRMIHSPEELTDSWKEISSSQRDSFAEAAGY